VKFLSKLVHPLSQKLTGGARGLDFGCGPGPAIASILAESGMKVENYDPIYFPNEGLLKGRYDFVTCTEVVEHLRKPRQGFETMDLILKVRGYLGVMTQVLGDDEDFANWWYPNDPTHIAFYQRKTLEWIGDWMGWGVEFPQKNVIIYSKLT